MTAPTIGQVARRTGLPAKTIRYYEEIGLVPSPTRAPNGYRMYDERSVQLLRFVKRARELGFAIEEVTELLALWQRPDRTSAEVRALATEHIRGVELKIAQLEDMRRALVELTERCHGDDRPDCPILDELAGQPRRQS